MRPGMDMCETEVKMEPPQPHPPVPLVALVSALCALSARGNENQPAGATASVP